MDKLLNLIGLAQKAGRLAVGEEPTGAAARARDARLILVAADAAENSVRRVRHFADAGQCLWCRIGADKDALGRAVGRSSCAMLAVTDIGFAEAIAKKLAEGDERFAETAEKLARQLVAALSRITDQVDWTVLGHLVLMRLKLLPVDMLRSRICLSQKISFSADVYDYFFPLVLLQFFYGSLIHACPSFSILPQGP